MKEFIGKKVLATTFGWFYGKDGLQYRAIYGTLKNVHEAKEAVGFAPNRTHANWFFEIGNMVIMGCQIMYLEHTDNVHLGEVREFSTEGGKATFYTRPSQIYQADEIQGAAPKPTPRHERSM